MLSVGRIDEAGVEPVLVLLSVRSVSGTLTVQSPENVVAVRFRNGEIVGADALGQSFGEGLGRVLIEQGHLEPSAIERVENEELSGTVEEHLLHVGLVSEEELGRGVREHAYRVLCSLLTWRSGEYQFYEGEVSPSRAVQPLSVEEVLVRASEQGDVGSEEPVPPLSDEVLRPVLQGRSFRVLSWEDEQLPAPGAEAEVWLTPFDDGLLRSLDGLTPARDFADRLGVDEYKLRFALDRLRRADLVEVVPEGEAGTLAGVEAPPVTPSEAPAEPLPLGETLEERPDVGLPSAVPREDEGLEEVRALLSDLSRGFGYVLAAGLAVLLLVLVVAGQGISHLLLPMPWQAPERQAVQASQETALARKLSSRLKTYYILYGRFPLDLRPLIDTHLLSAADLEDSKGREVVLQPFEEGYSLAFKEEGEEELAAEFRVDAQGDFLLDPELTMVEAPAGGVPLRLVD